MIRLVELDGNHECNDDANEDDKHTEHSPRHCLHTQVSETLAPRSTQMKQDNSCDVQQKECNPNTDDEWYEHFIHDEQILSSCPVRAEL